MIKSELIQYIDIYDVLSKFSELTESGTTQGGIWNADFTRTVYDVKLPTNDEGHVLAGESKYIYKLTSPEDYLDCLTNDKESFKEFILPKTYLHTRLGEVQYFEIGLITIILWLMKNNELKVEDAIYYMEW